MAGFDPDKARTEFSVPEGFVPLTAIAIGYAGDASMLPEALAKREAAERTRRPQKEFVFAGTWGKVFE
jgi:hypothetical protein